MNELPVEDFIFRLYVAGEAPNSRVARANLDDFCREYLSGRCRVEIVDILDDPLRAIADKILVTPTLVRLFPLPQTRLVGNLSERSKVINILALGAFNE